MCDENKEIKPPSRQSPLYNDDVGAALVGVVRPNQPSHCNLQRRCANGVVLA